MHPDQASDPKLLAHYEGLIRQTAWRYVGHCEEDYDDICQIFRVKAWKALLSFDPSKVKTTGRLTLAEQRDRYVFACIKNQGKDLVKRVRRNWAFIEDYAAGGARGGGEGAMRDAFEFEYLMAAEDEVFQVLHQGGAVIPNTLSPNERQVVTLLYLDFDNGEIAAFLNVDRKQVVTVVAGIREKMADWAPTGAAPRKLSERNRQAPQSRAPQAVVGA